MQVDVHELGYNGTVEVDIGTGRNEYMRGVVWTLVRDGLGSWLLMYGDPSGYGDVHDEMLLSEQDVKAILAATVKAIL